MAQQQTIIAPAPTALPRWESSLIIISFLLMMKAFIPLLELGPVDQTNRENSVILPPLLFLTYIFPLIYLAWNWQETLIKIRRLWAVFLLLGYLLLSAVWSQSFEITLFRTLSALLTTLFAVYISIRCTPEQIMQLFGKTIVTILVTSVVFVGVLPSLAIRSGGLYGGTWNGIFQTKNALGLVLGIGFITLILQALGARRKQGFLLVPFCFIVLFLSDAKTSLAASVMTLFLLFGFGVVRSIAPTRLPIFLAIGIVGTFVFLVVLGSDYGAILALMGRDETFTNRSEIWEVAAKYIRQELWHGYGYRAFFARPDVQALFQQMLQGRVPAHSHNMFIEMMLDGGLIGLALFLLMLLQSFYRGVVYSISQPWAARYWYIAIMVYILMIGQLEAFSFSNYLWVLVVLVSGAVPTRQPTPAISRGGV